MNDSKIMVLGAGGQLGSEWVRFLKNKQVSYRAYDSSQLDIKDSITLRDTILKTKPTVIINCAAYSQVDRAEKEYERAKAVNADALWVLSEAARKSGSLLVHYSTDYVFPGRQSDRIAFPDGYREEDQPDPVNAYGRSKLAGEEAVRETLDRYLIIRLSWLNGFFGNNFVKTMLRLGSEKETLRVVNDQFGSPTYTKNVVRNSWILLSGGYEGIYHLTSKGLISWFDLAVEIFRLAGLNVTVNPIPSGEFPSEAERPHFSKLCTDKISEVHGIELIDWKEGLEDLLRELNFKH